MAKTSTAEKETSSNDSSGMAELEASIFHQGVIYPLIVVQNGTEYFVTAGNRRLKALRKLFLESEPHKAVPVIDTHNFTGDMREIAMAVNIALPPHPVDRYEVLAAQAKAGLSFDEIALRNALAPAQVNRIMALAALAPEIRDAWRNGDIEADVARAYTLAPSIDEQKKVFEKLSKQDNQSALNVKDRFVGKQKDAGKLVAFVGLDAYEAAGGTVKRDLFGTDHTVSDIKLLQKLYQEKMASVCEALVSTDGWSFALPEFDLKQDRYYFGQLSPDHVKPTKEEKARMDLISKQLGDADRDDADFTPEEQALSDEFDGIESAVKLRRFTPDLRAKSGCFVMLHNDGRLNIEYGRVKPEEKNKVAAQERAKKNKKEKKPDGKLAPVSLIEVSQTLDQRLTAWLLAATAEALVNVTKKGSLEHALASVVASQIVPERPHSMPDKVSGKLPALRVFIHPRTMQTALMEQFDHKDYFASISRPMITHAVNEAMGKDHATKVAAMSKDDAAKFATVNIAKTKWLPPQLRLSTYDGPGKKK